MCAAKAEPSAPAPGAGAAWQRGDWGGGTGYRGYPRTTTQGLQGVYKGAGQTTEGAHHWGPLCMGGRMTHKVPPSPGVTRGDG